MLKGQLGVLKRQLGVMSHLQLVVLRPEFDVVRQQSLASDQGEDEGLTVCLGSSAISPECRKRSRFRFSTLPRPQLELDPCVSTGAQL